MNNSMNKFTNDSMIQGGGSLHTFSETRMKVDSSHGLQSIRNGYYYSKTVSYCTSYGVGGKDGSAEIVHGNLCYSAKPFIYIGVRSMISCLEALAVHMLLIMIITYVIVLFFMI